MPARAPTPPVPRRPRRGPLTVEPLTDRAVPSATGLVLSTGEDVNGGGTPGLDTWTKGEAVQFGDPNLALGSGATAGTFSSLANLEAFGDGDVDLDGFHYVSRPVTVGTGPGAFTLLPGDLLFSTTSDETLTSLTTVTFTRDEVVVFRPAAPGDYTSGTFFLLLNNFRDVHGGGDTRDFALVEVDTVVGDVTLTAGSFLFARDGGSEDDDIRWFVPTSVGGGRTAGSVVVLLDGNDLNFSAKISGLELVSADTTVGGTVLPAGTILLSVGSDGGVVGTNALPTRKSDVVALQVTRTTLGSGTSVATASTLFRGAAVGLDTSAEALDAIGLITTTAPPTAADDGFTTPEDTPLTVAGPGVLANDIDPDGNPLTAVLVSGPANGTVALNADGSFTYVPNPNFSGTDTFAYRAAGAGATSAPATVTVAVTPVNDRPVAADDSYTIGGFRPSLTMAAPGVLANDTDVEAGPLTAVLVSGPTNGTLTLNPTGSFTYDPDLFFLFGTDTFTYQVRDADGALSAPATVAITVALTPNRAPAGAADGYTTAEDTPLVVSAPGVLADDTDPDGDSLTATLVSGPANGTVALNPDGSFTYAPNPNFSGTDTFTYEARDGSRSSGPVTVTLTVTPVNDAPTLGPISDLTVPEDAGPQTVGVTGITAGGGESQTLTVTATSSNPALVPDPVVSYTSPAAIGTLTLQPVPDGHGTALITVTVSDGTLSVTQTFVVAVTPVNDGPRAVADSYATSQNTVLTVAGPGVLGNDTDVDGDPLTVVVVTGPANGALVLNPDGSFDYSPDSGFRGTDTFVYQVTDPSGTSATATVTIRVIPPSGNPDGQDDSYTVVEDTPLVVPPSGVLANDTPPGNLPLTAQLVAAPSNGTLALNADGSFAYTPNPDFTGTDSFTYKAVDVNNGASGAVHVRITVTPAQDPPVAAADRYVTNTGVTLAVPGPGVLANDADPDGDPLTAALVAGPANGTLTFNADGSFTYTPNAGFVGDDSFTYQVTDGTATVGPVTVTITVRPLVPPPPPPPPPPGEPPPTTGPTTPTDPVVPPPVTPGPGPVDRPVTGTPPGDGGSTPTPGPPVLVLPPVVAAPGLITAGPPAAYTLITVPAGPFAVAPLPAIVPPALPPVPTLPVLPPPIALDVPRPPITIPPLPVLPDTPIVPPIPFLQADNPVFTGLTELREQVEQGTRVELVAGTVAGTGVVATAGYVLLSPRLAFWLLSALLARRTVWKPFDPLEVVYAWERERKAGGDDGDDESLEKMVG